MSVDERKEQNNDEIDTKKDKKFSEKYLKVCLILQKN